MKFLKTLVCFCVLFVLLASAATLSFADTNSHARGVILFIGDGMGLNVVRAAEIYAQAVNKEPLIFDALPIRGVTITRSANSEVTDSAAAITALMSGKKTNNGRLNILPDHTVAYTIPKAAREKGLSIGVVSTTRLTHATPGGGLRSGSLAQRRTAHRRPIFRFGPGSRLGRRASILHASDAIQEKQTD